METSTHLAQLIDMAKSQMSLPSPMVEVPDESLEMMMQQHGAGLAPEEFYRMKMESEEFILEGHIQQVKKRLDKNSREQQRYGKILTLIENLRERLELAGVINGKVSKSAIISAAADYIDLLKQKCESSYDPKSSSQGSFHKTVFSGAPYPLAVASLQGKFIEVNELFAQHCSCTSKHLLLQGTMFGLIPPVELPDVYMRLGTLMKEPHGRSVTIRTIIPSPCRLYVNISVTNAEDVMYFLVAILTADELQFLNM